MGNEVRIHSSLDDKVSGGLQRIADKFELLGGKGSAASLFGNVGAKAVAKGFDLIGGAADKAIEFISSSIEKARADEESQNRLAASLRANVPAWNGHTEAIEKNILSAQRLGFEDETLRDSLTVLVGATHNVGKAQDIMAIAMDLARFKGIDLKTASEALIKVEGGHYRALAQLGIKLKEGATQTDALAAVQAIAAGQAEAYANTNTGKLAVSQIKVDEAMEHFGYVVMPAVTEGFIAAGEAADVFAAGIDVLNGKLPESKQGTIDLGAELLHLAGAVTPLGPLFNKTADQIAAMPPVVDAAAVKLNESFQSSSRDVGRSIAVINTKVDSIETHTSRVSTRVQGWLNVIVQSFINSRTAMQDAASGVANAMWDPLIAKANLAATERAIAEQRLIITAKDSTKAQIADAKLRILELSKTKEEQIGILASYGNQAAVDTLQAQVDALKSTKNMTAEQIAWLKKLEIELAKARAKAVELALAIDTGHNSGSNVNAGRATGGPVRGTFVAGESGPETIVMGGGQSAYVISNANGGGQTGGGGIPVQIPIYLDGREIARVVDEHLQYGYASAARSKRRS